jgi:hypothetical protein
MKKLLSILFLILLSLAFGKLVYKISDGVSTRRFLATDRIIDWQPSAEIEKILEMPFYYLGRGRQCFAFETKDQKYVLKLPRTDIYSMPFLLEALPFQTKRDAKKVYNTEKERLIYESFELASNELKEETATIATHLGKSICENKFLKIHTKAGIRYELALDQTCFALQEKKNLLIPQLQACMQNKEKDKAKEILLALLQNIVHRAKLNIFNRDRSFLKNYSYENKKAYQIDIGSFYRSTYIDPELIVEKSARDSLEPIQQWLQAQDTELYQFFNLEIEKALNE